MACLVEMDRDIKAIVADCERFSFYATLAELIAISVERNEILLFAREIGAVKV